MARWTRDRIAATGIIAATRVTVSEPQHASLLRFENPMASATVCLADLDSPVHQRAVLEMLDGYSCDPFGDSKPLSEYTRTHLIEGLRRHPTTRIHLLFEGDRVCGIATTFVGFSTFAAKPLVNLHDLYVAPEGRGRGYGALLLRAVQADARALGCCKVTLEVQTSNLAARRLYEQCGFAQALYPADEAAGGGGSLFMTCPLHG